MGFSVEQWPVTVSDLVDLWQRLHFDILQVCISTDV